MLNLAEKRLYRVLEYPKHLQTTLLVLLRLGLATASEVASCTGKARAVESAYLNQLCILRVAVKSRRMRRAYFQVVLEALEW